MHSRSFFAWAALSCMRKTCWQHRHPDRTLHRHLPDHAAGGCRLVVKIKRELRAALKPAGRGADLGMNNAQIVNDYRAGRSLLDLHLESWLTIEKIKAILTGEEGVAIRPRSGHKGCRNTAHKFRDLNYKRCG
jgi:hypothetical protein